MRKCSLQKKRAVTGILFLVPLLTGLLFFFAKPIIESIIFSFSRFHFGQQSGYTLDLIGFDNYYAVLFKHPDYLEKLVNSIITMVSQVPLIVIFSFFISNLLNQKFRGRLPARVILFLPVIISSAAIMSFDAKDLYQTSFMTGTSGFKDAFFPGQGGDFSADIAQLLKNLDFAENAVAMITAAVNKIYEVISFSGIQILIFLAGLQSIPRSLYESAEIEGASGWESFWKITFPMISPLILVCAAYSVIDNFTQYNNQVMETIHAAAFSSQEFGQSAAMAWIYCIITLFCIGVVYLLFSRKVYYYDR